MVTKRTKVGTVPEFERIPAADILFDPQNPRLGGDSTSNQSKLQSLLMEEPHYAKELVESFLENGFIEYEPLVVRQSADHYIVIEGNRRLAAVKHILDNPEQYPASIREKLENVPVLIFRSGGASERKEIRTYLGVRHLQGYREWPAESKAIFLDKNITAQTDFKKLKREFGIDRRDIGRYLIPYRVRKAGSQLLDELETGDEQSFWILGEALGRSGIKEYIQLDIDPKSFKIRGFDKTKFRYLLEFLYGSTRQSGRAGGLRRITDTRHLSRLSKVLANKRASAKLENGSTLEEAELYISTPEETIEGLISELLVILQRIIALNPNPAQIKKIAGHFRSFDKAIRTK